MSLKIARYVIFASIFCFVFQDVSLNPTPVKRSESKKDQCNKTVEIYEDVSSPEVTEANFGKPMTCWYRFRSFRGTPKDWILRIKFNKFKIGNLLNGTHCEGGYLQIVDGNAKTDVSNRKEPGIFCGESEQPQTFMSETSFVKVLFHVENFTDQTYLSFDTRAEQQLVVYLRYGQHPELYPNRRGEVVQGSYCERIFRDCRLQTCYVQSPAYPGIYPRNLHCRYYLNTRLPFIKLYIENEEFNVDGQRCENIMTCPMRPISSGDESCPYDYIKIYDGKNEFSPVIGTFCGMGKFPYSIIGTSQDLFVEFVSSPAGPLLNTGFHFNVGNWPGHVDTAGSRNGTCDWLLSSESLRASGDSEGIFLSVAHWYPPHTSCTYLMQGEEDEIVRLYFPSFRINRIESPIKPIEGDCGESLTLYDASWPDDSKIIKTFCDTFSKAMEKHDFVSTGNSLFVRFESKTGSYSGSSLYYWAHYDFFNNTKLGEAVPGKQCDEIFSSWKQVKGWLRSPLNTLVYKTSQKNDDVSCLYRFVTDKRLFARVILTINNVYFKEHPYNHGPCTNCLEDRLDKLVIWEPLPPGANSSHNLISLNKAAQNGDVTCICSRQAFSTQIISRGEHLNLQMIIDSTHSALSYFKHPASLFEATYEFVHGPLCGPAIIQPITDGEIHYPYYEAIGYVEPPKSIRCIWEIKVNRDRDFWLHFDQIKFSSKLCDDGIVDIFLKGRVDPYLSVCGENVSLAKELPILSSAELSPDGSDPSITIQFVGRTSPTRAAFKIAWTEMFHLPRNVDGSSLISSRLTEGSNPEDPLGDGCEFPCPGEQGLCIPARLVCNGVVNCPNVTDYEGATDSAVPCAMILNLAKILHTELKSLKSNDILSLKLLFLDGEEAFEKWGPTDSIYGAKHLSTLWERNRRTSKLTNEVVSDLERIDLFVLLDLIGHKGTRFLSCFEDTQHWFLQMAKTEDKLAELDLLKNNRGRYFEKRKYVGYIEDDHIPFLQKHVPIMHLISIPFPTEWHTENDNRDIIDMKIVEDINKILRIFVVQYLNVLVQPSKHTSHHGK